MKKAQGKRWISILLAVVMIASTASVCLASVSAKREKLLTNNGESSDIVLRTSTSPFDAIENDVDGTTHSYKYYNGRTGSDSNVEWEYDVSTRELIIYGSGNMGEEICPWRAHRLSIETVKIGNNVTSISDEAFLNCYNLTKVIIPDGLERIGARAFSGCSALSCIHIPSSVNTIGSDCFSGCYAYICSGTTDCYAKSYADKNHLRFQICDESHGQRSLEWTFDSETNTLTISGSGYIDNCDHYGYGETPWSEYRDDIDSVIIDYGITGIGTKSFAGCTNLTHVKIPSSVNWISSSAFDGCTKLSSFLVDADNPNYCNDNNGVIYDKHKSRIVLYPSGNTSTTFIIPSSVQTICNESFSNCVNLTNIVFPESVKEIGWGAFRDCNNLENLSIPDSVDFIGSYAFFGCHNLQNITIPDILSIGDNVFEGCSSLQYLTVPDSVVSIGHYAFWGCESLRAITIGRDVAKIENDAFGCRALAEIVVNADNKQYSSDNNGVLYNKDQTKLIQYPSGNLRESFSIPNTVTAINQNAFRESINLTSINIPNNVITIGKDAFCFCEMLADVTLSDGLTNIEADAFRDCEKLTDITIPYSVTSIGSFAFFNCSNMSFVHIPKSVTNIGQYAFYSFSHSILSYEPLPLYICSDTADCYAKTYAEENGIEFRICTNHDPSVAIRDFVPEKTVGYRETLTFAADVTNAVDGAEVHWFINGEDAGTGETYTTTEVTKDFTVQAKYMKDGAVLAESETETVNVKSGFVDRLVAFFRILFGKLLALFRKYFCVIFK